MKKKSGIELLSRSQICSTIAAGPLIDRVRDGNVSCKPAMDTGKRCKKDVRRERQNPSGEKIYQKILKENIDITFSSTSAWQREKKKKVVKPHDKLVILS